MKKIAIICIVLLIGVLFFSCTKTDKPKEQKTDLEILNLKGKVKQVKESTFEAIDKFGEIVKGDRTNYLENSRIIFNESGDEIEEYFALGSHLKQRDTKPVKKTVSGLIKLIHPDGIFSKEDIREYLIIAIEMIPAASPAVK